jgi:chitinase
MSFIFGRHHRYLRLLLSIGGWSFSKNFSNLVDPAHRTNFARSAVRILEDYGLDGLDVSNSSDLCGEMSAF